MAGDISVPTTAPWEDVKGLMARIDRLTSVMESMYGVGAPGVTQVRVSVPGAGVRAGGTTLDLRAMMEFLVPEVRGASSIIPFKKEIAVAYQNEQERMVPTTGVIRDVIMAFPSGCNQLVEVRLIYKPNNGGLQYIVPTLDESFIALDDFTAVFQPRTPVIAPGVLRAEWYNYDSLNTHSVPVIVTLFPAEVTVNG